MESSSNKPASSGVSIGELLTKDLIRIRLPHHDKVVLMEYLVRELCAAKFPADFKRLLVEMIRREGDGVSTTLDTGLSLPHARVDGLSKFAAIFGLLKDPVPDLKQKGYPIRAMFLFFSPDRPEAYPQQLQLLRNIALLFQDAFLNSLLKAAAPEQVLQMIRDREAAIRAG